MIEKQQQITFNKGITNVPSDAICDDGELSTCQGLTSEHGELKPIQNPSSVNYLNYKLLYVHGGRYIYVGSYTPPHGTAVNVISWTVNGNDGSIVSADIYRDGTTVTSVGNTLIINNPSSKSMKYYLWNGTGYSLLGTKIPEPDVQLCLAEEYSVKDEFVLEGMIYYEDHLMKYEVVLGQQNSYNDAIVGGFYKVLKTVHQKKGFAFPVVARVAVELYDGTYVLHSSPIVLLPMYKATTIARINGSPERFSIKLFGQKIHYKMSADFDNWDDIVRNVVLFVSKEIPIFDTTRDAIIESLYDVSFDGWKIVGEDSKLDCYNSMGTNSEGTKYNVLQAFSDDEVKKNITETSLFFKLCDLGKAGTNNTWRSTDELFNTNTIENIEVQEQLSNDDYYSHCELFADYLYPYNNRLHLANASRSLFDGFNFFMPYNTQSTKNYYIATYIRTTEGDKIVVNSFSSKQAMGYYYFYPDPRAYKAEIYLSNSSIYKTMTLVEHPALNGAYYFEGFPTYPNPASEGFASHYAPDPTGTSGTLPTPSEYSFEMLPNSLIVSEVNNPFVFLSKGYVTVGNEKIIGMAAITMALSEYQHGHQPLIVFGTDGIWSLTLNSEGYYTSVQAVSREVCNNESSITQVDYGIYFASDKGLMYLNTGGVKCVSNQLRGTEFDKFIDSCFIAYDYRDSLLHIYMTYDSLHPQTSPYHYVYNMKTGTFSTKSDSAQIASAVSDYPDTLIQTSAFATYSLLNKPDEQNDPGTGSTGSYSAQLKTRPMKLENSLALKSILQARHIMQLSTGATLKFRVWASNNLDSWVELSSLRGKPWKYYKFRYDFTNLKAVDRFAGTVLITQERRTDKLR